MCAFSGANPNPYWQVWTHNQIGNITNFRDLTGDHFYTYNPSGTGAVRPHAPTAAYNQTGLTYDPNGSRTGYTTTTGTGTGAYVLTWDRQNRLATVTKTGGTNTGTSRFTYNTNGQRLVREDPDGTLTWYLGPLELRKPTGATTLSWTRYYTIAGTTIAYRTGTGTTQTLTWLAGNNQSSATIAIPNGTLTAAQTRYHPYGTTRGSDQLTTTEHGFLGQTEDTRTTLNYLNNRYQDPTTGTFLSVDPLVSKTGAAYLYAAGNPTTLSDPGGLYPMKPCPDGECNDAKRSSSTTRRMDKAIENADLRFGPKPDDWCGRIACPDWGARYPEAENDSEFINLFRIDPMDAYRLYECDSRACQVNVLRGSRSDIRGASTDAIDDAVLDDVLEWAGAKSYESCGTSAGGVELYCVAVTRLPSKRESSQAMTIGHFILYDVTEIDQDYEQPDGFYSLKNGDPELFRHELGHVPQWERFGSDFLWMYMKHGNAWECQANETTGTDRGAC